MPESGGSHGTPAPGADGGPPHAEPAALGLNATAWVALAHGVVIAIMIWKKVPPRSAAPSTARSKEYESSSTRPGACAPEAEALRAEYEAKQARAEPKAGGPASTAPGREPTRSAPGRTDAGALIERRTRHGRDKIAACERARLATSARRRRCRRRRRRAPDPRAPLTPAPTAP
jgi:F-type H+-transporting ATPase subunit b